MRRAAEKAVKSNGFEPWLFENGPASELDAISTYEQGVEKSEFFIWITKGITTDGTKREVVKALHLGKPIIAVFVSMTNIDDLTKELIIKVRKVATSRTIENSSELKQEISIALKGLTARRIRQGRTSNLAEVLESLKVSSVTRCFSSFTYVRVPSDIASALAADVSVGAFDKIQNKTGVTILYGDLGAGKTLAAERAHQNAVTRALMGGPFPIWRRADSIKGALEDEIRQATKNLVDPSSYGVHLVIDGLDESELNYANILAESQALSAAWPDTTIIFTVRPIPDIVNHPLATKIPELSDEACLGLSALTGVAPHSLYSLTPALRSAVRKPLFALLLGSALKENVAADAPQALVAHLVADILKRHKVSEVQRSELVNLAIKTTDRRGSVPLLEVPNAESLLSTGLILTDTLSARFTLVVIGQWFAALALQSENIKLSSLGKDLGRLLLWRQTIATAIAAGDESIKSRLLLDAASCTPALFAWLIGEAIPSGYTEPISVLPTEHESGQQIRSAMNATVDVLGRAAPFVTPVLSSGLLPPLGIRVDKNGILWSWWNGEEPIPKNEIIRLEHEPDGNFSHHRWETNAGRSGWAWRLVLRAIQDKFDDVLKARQLPVAPSLQKERDWIIFCAISNLKFDSTGVISSDIHKQIEYILNIDPLGKMEEILFNNTKIYLSELEDLRKRIPKDGRFDLPWPLPDRTGGSFVGDNYSNAQLESRVRAVFSAALDAHRWYSENLFGSLSNLLPKYAIRPANCDIHIITGENDGMYGKSLAWSLEPIEERGKDCVNITWEDQGFSFAPKPEHWEHVKAMRSYSEFFGHTHYHQIMDIFGNTPSTDLVYGWLTEDLKVLKWIK